MIYIYVHRSIAVGPSILVSFSSPLSFIRRLRSGSSSSRSSQSMAGKAALGATKITLSTSKSALQLVPIPGIAAAVDGLLSVINAIEVNNGEQLSELSSHIERLLKLMLPLTETLGNGNKANLSGTQKDRIESLIVALNEVLEEERSILLHGRFKRFLMHEDIRSTISNINQKINNALDRFLVQGNVALELAASKTYNRLEQVREVVVATGHVNTEEIQNVGRQVRKLTEEWHSDAIESKTTNQTLRAELMSRAQIDLVNSLPHAEARYDAASRFSASNCLEGTRVDLLRLIRGWVHTNDLEKPRIFWLCGLAGTGKSTIAQSIAEELDNSRTLGATFFFSRNSADCSNALLVFSTIARQLAFAIPEFGVRIAEAMEANRDAGKLVMNAQMEKLIIEPLRSVKNPPNQTVIVIDALDECSDRKLAQDILILFAGKICTLPFPLTIFITSRSELHIKSKFETPILRPISRPFILHDIEQSIVDGDIELFLRQKMKEIAAVCLIKEI
ncbi:hypothetical protein J3R30DRAFT_633240 [Lentinula aciculospora]|uniref:NACHT domain-containing protein n=1 Tax=Lentinula aciculospora TaxID=153920 RepID=A0A9W9A6A8_9AGAR|nr:hypothetical protein J3R30DRAFT_633240 [Lentinula aciculospora]